MPRIHIFGASGSGCTTLGRSLAERLGLVHLDADDYFWLPTPIPFTECRPRVERRTLLERGLDRQEGWVLSGSLCGWGDFAAERFDLAVFLTVPTEVRLERLAVREAARFGASIEPGGHAHERFAAFIAWAAGYDEGEISVRSRALHQRWITTLGCRVLRLNGDMTNDARIDSVLDALGGAAG
jgi:adenylate kinase family enzyme